MWFMDHSLGRNGYKRLFEFDFFDDAAARLFFNMYTAGVKEDGVPFDVMVGGSGKEDGSDNNKMEESEEQRKQGGGKNEQEENEEQELELVEKNNEWNKENAQVEQEEQDKLQDILESEDIWGGESQNLFNPHYPGGRFE